MRNTTIALLTVSCLCSATSPLSSEVVTIGNRRFTIPDGFRIELATTPGLTERPIVVDHDDDGNLYVAESSGTNDNVQQQLRDKPHSILRLTDTDGDGKYDQRTEFADRMMFPEGVLWHAGSIFVAAPPQIWKLTDTNQDGRADQREIWFDGKTLTGCANDLHGPYLGPDGWIYWCKGAFAEQTYQRVTGPPLVTRAAHIFRRRPEGGPIEPVMTGGMDNPVELVFTPTGERIFSTTFFQHPGGGRRDGLVHAIYGGVYGKRHSVLDGHPRTGDLMPVLTHLGAAAPSGLARLQSNALGYGNQILSACFNLHSVKRHDLTANGATFTTKDSDLVYCDDLDFHPTDVIEDADGTVLIVDTGGWYKLCCPTSQLHKPDVPGAIYRLSRQDGESVADPRGLAIDWNRCKTSRLVELLDDQRFAVRNRAIALLGARADAVPKLTGVLNSSLSPQARRSAVWAACRIDSSAARRVVRSGLRDAADDVRHTAIHAVSVWRDPDALHALTALLADESPAVRRAAAEAIGRIGKASAVQHILAALGEPNDRTLEHSLIYALIEINAPEQTRSGLKSNLPQVRRAAIRALYGMRDGKFGRDEVSELLSSSEAEIRLLATEIAQGHPEWGPSYVEVLKRELKLDARSVDLASQIARLANSDAVKALVADLLESDSVGADLRIKLLNALPGDLVQDSTVQGALKQLLVSENPDIVASVVRYIARADPGEGHPFSVPLKNVARSLGAHPETQLLAVACLRRLEDELFDQTVTYLAPDQPALIRSLAVTALSNQQLTSQQLSRLADNMDSVGPLELSRLLDLFATNHDSSLGVRLFTALAQSPSAAALPIERVANLASKFGEATMKVAQPLLTAANVDPAEQSKHLEQLLGSLPAGNVRRGQQLFHNDKIACFSCHQVGYRGGTIGPDLSRIARTRSRRDMLEAIIYPSLSFVRSYEPVIVVTSDGRQLSGTMRDQSANELVLQLSATEQRTISREQVETTLPGKVSIMPAGLDQQLTQQDLADLLAFLESRK